jgi:hypothetical protein
MSDGYLDTLLGHQIEVKTTLPQVHTGTLLDETKRYIILQVNSGSELKLSKKILIFTRNIIELTECF